MATNPDAATKDEQLPEGADKRAYVQEMFDRIAPRYDLLNTLMTFGLDRRWRVRTVRALGLERGAAVLDLASGTGPLLATLRRRGLRAVGADLSFEMLVAGGGRAAGSLQGDAAALPVRDGGLDGVVSGFALRNFADLAATFAELARVLRPGGRIALLEVDRPSNALLRLGHHVWFQTVVPRLGALLSDARAYSYLPRSVAYLPAPSALAAALELAGFTDVERLRLSGGLTQVVTATRRARGGTVTGVTLVAPDGEALAPETLCVEELHLSADEARALGQAAARVGRVLARDDFALRGLGAAANIELAGGLAEKGAARAAGALLAAVPAPGDAPAIAIGALPFDPTAAAHLTLPRLVVAEAGGVTSARVIRHAAERFDRAALLEELMAGNGHPTAPPERFRLAPAGSHAAFRRRVAAALVEIEQGRFDKVVLAREVTVHADRPFRPEHLIGRLRRLHPSCCTFSVDGIVGASPELLIRRAGGLVTSQPLAGTVGRSGDPDEDRRLAESLLSSEKERAEHRYVVDAIRDALTPFTDALSVPEIPHLMELRNVVHLATTIEGQLASEAAGCLELTAAIHPTPAVCGTPREAALEYLRANEPLARDRYAGPVGYLDGAGDGEFWLAIRSAMLEGRGARLLAGVGIVAGSVPEDELAETQLKLQALLAAAVRP